MQQTMRTANQWSSDHPYQAKSVQELPAALRQAALAALPTGETPNRIFILPEHVLSQNPSGLGGMKRLPDQALLFTEHGLLHVQLSKPGSETVQTCYLRGATLDYAQISLVLLYGRLELVESGGEKRLLVEYNAVIHELLQPALQDFLRLAWAPTQPGPDEDEGRTQRLLGELTQQAYKFGNGLRLYALPAGESLHGCVLQPRRTRRYLGMFERASLAGSLFALTDHELVLIQEGLRGAGVHGYYFSHCPRQNVSSVEAAEGSLRVQMKTGEIKMRMEEAKARECMEVWEKTRDQDR